MTKFTKQQKFAVAAIFGHCNMGQPVPKADTLRGLFHPRHPEYATLDNAVMHISGDLMETDEHQDWFNAEAKSWLKNKKLDSLEGIRSVSGWKDIADVVEAAMQETVS